MSLHEGQSSATSIIIVVCMILFFMQSKSVERPTHSIKGTAYIVAWADTGVAKGSPVLPFLGIKDFCFHHGLVKSHSIGVSHIYFYPDWILHSN